MPETFFTASKQERAQRPSALLCCFQAFAEAGGSCGIKGAARRLCWDAFFIRPGRDARKRLRSNSPADPDCLSEETKVCEEEEPEFLLEDGRSSRPPRLRQPLFLSTFKRVKASNFCLLQ